MAQRSPECLGRPQFTDLLVALTAAMPDAKFEEVCACVRVRAWMCACKFVHLDLFGSGPTGQIPGRLFTGRRHVSFYLLTFL